MTESSIQSEARDAYEQVFGPENPGRVRCVGRGPTPSKYFSNLECTSSTGEVTHLKDRVKDLEEKLDIVTSAVCKLVESKVQDEFQVSARAESKKVKKNLHQSSRINRDQVSARAESKKLKKKFSSII